MKTYNNEFVEYIRDLLEPFEISGIRPMFGGFGIYKNGIMFALIIDNELYFKADTSAAEFFQNFGSEPFVYESRGKQVKLSYWRVLPEILDDEETLNEWLNMAYSAALSAKQSSKLRKKKE